MSNSSTGAVSNSLTFVCVVDIDGGGNELSRMESGGFCEVVVEDKFGV